MASRQLVLFLFLLLCINLVVVGFIFNHTGLLFLSCANVIIAMIVAMRDFFTVPSDAEQSSLLSIGMLGYLSALLYAGYSLHIAPAILAVAGTIAFLILIGLLLKRGKKFAFLVGVTSLIGGVIYFITHSPEKTSTSNIIVVSGQDQQDTGGINLLSGSTGFTGEIQDDSILVGSGITNGNTLSGDIPGEVEEVVAPVSKNLLTITRDTRIATYANFLPLLLKKYQLSSKGNITFSFVSKSNILYPSFVAAYQKGLIGIHTNPTTALKCKYIMTMIGLLEAPALQNGSTNVHATYREYARKRGYLTNGCDQKEEIGTYATLP